MRRLLLAAALAALAAGATADVAAAGCTHGACARHRAHTLLSDRVFIKFTETGSIGNPSSLDQRLHLCGDGSFVYDSVSYIEATGTSSSQRTTGSWRVRSAHLSRNGKRGRARVRGTPDGGGPKTTVRISWTRRSARVDGDEVTVDDSDLC